MTEINYTVSGSVKKPYEKPEIEVFDLDAQPMMLAGSPYVTQQGGYDYDDI